MLRSMLLNTVVMQVAEQSNAEGGATVALPTNPMLAGAHVPDEVGDLIADLVIKQEDVRMGPVDLYYALSKFALLDEFPEVGTSYSDENKPNNPETFKDGKGVEHNYFTDYMRGTKQGLAWFRRVNDLKRAIANEADLALKVSDENKDILEKVADSVWLKDQKALFDGRLQNGRNMIRKTIMIRDTLDKMAQFSDVVGFQFNMVADKDGNKRPARTKQPITIVDVGSKELLKPSKPLTLGDFLKLNNKATIEKAITNGRTYTGFVAALERETNKGREEAAKIVIQSVGQLFTPVRALADWMDQGKHQEAILKELAKPENDQLLLAIGDLTLALDGYWEHIKGRHARLKQATLASMGATPEARREVTGTNG